MLSSLRKYDRRTREGILANLASSYLPDPGTFHDDPVDSIMSTLLRELDMEVKAKLNIKTAELTETDKYRVYSLLSKEISSLVIDSSKIKGVRERLGQKGMLRPDLYEILFEDRFRQINLSLGVTIENVNNVLRTPYATEHLLPEMFDKTNVTALSLYLGTPTLGEDSSSLLVLARRENARLIVMGAWRLFQKDLDLSSIRTPLDAMKIFLDRYGATLNVGDKRERFVLYKMLPVEPSVNTNIFHIENKQNDTVDVFFLVRPSQGRFEVAMAFAVNASTYAESLIAHGITVTRKFP